MRPAVIVLLLLRLDPGSPTVHHHGTVLQADAELVRLEETAEGEVSGGPKEKEKKGCEFLLGTPSLW